MHLPGPVHAIHCITSHIFNAAAGLLGPSLKCTMPACTPMQATGFLPPALPTLLALLQPQGVLRKVIARGCVLGTPVDT